MKTTTYSDFRQNLKRFLDSTAESHSPLVITRQEGNNMVVMSLEDYNSHMETIYLLSNSKNAEHLKRSMWQIEHGFVKEFTEEEFNTLADS